MNHCLKILCKSNTSLLSCNQKVKQIGKYIYNHIDGAFKYKSSSNMYDVYITVRYQVPYVEGISDKLRNSNDVNEMTVNLNITTYQNKIRVNLIEMSPKERTLGYDLYAPEKLENLEDAMHLIFNKVVKRLNKAYENYDFSF